MQLRGYIIDSTRLGLFGCGEEIVFERLEDAIGDTCDRIDRQRGLPGGTASAALRGWVMEARGAGPTAGDVLDAMLAQSPRDRLEHDAWSPVLAGALDDIDVALQRAGVPRNASLKKLAQPPRGASGRLLSLDDGSLLLLPGYRVHVVENTWSAPVGRLSGDDATRARALLTWWGLTRARHVEAALNGRQVNLDVLLVMSSS